MENIFQNIFTSYSDNIRYPFAMLNIVAKTREKLENQNLQRNSLRNPL